MMSFTKIVWMVVVSSTLMGCSLFTAKPTVPRQLHVTLVGGGSLNPGVTGDPRPVQACVYVVSVADWLPPAMGDDQQCASHHTDDAIVSESQHVIAPHQVIQFGMAIPQTGDLWLITDADYAHRAARYTPLKIRIEGTGLIHRAVWLDRNRLYDASLPGPVPLDPELSGPAPSQGDAKPSTTHPSHTRRTKHE